MADYEEVGGGGGRCREKEGILHFFKLHHVYKRIGLRQCNKFMGSAQDFASFVIVFLILGHLPLMP